MLKKKGKVEDTQLSTEYSDLIGTDWAQFEIQVTIPEIHIILKRHDAMPLAELVVDYMTSTTCIGLDYVDSSFSLHLFNILDHSYKISTKGSPIYPFLIETYISG
jgi:hypothetical protein